LIKINFVVKASPPLNAISQFRNISSTNNVMENVLSNTQELTRNYVGMDIASKFIQKICTL